MIPSFSSFVKSAICCWGVRGAGFNLRALFCALVEALFGLLLPAVRLTADMVDDAVLLKVCT